MTKRNSKQLKVNALDLLNEFTAAGDQECFKSKIAELLLNNKDEIPLEWYTIAGGKTDLDSLINPELYDKAGKIILNFTVYFTELYRISSYDLDSIAIRSGQFLLEIDKSTGEILFILPEAGSRIHRI